MRRITLTSAILSTLLAFGCEDDPPGVDDDAAPPAADGGAVDGGEDPDLGDIDPDLGDIDPDLGDIDQGGDPDLGPDPDQGGGCQAAAPVCDPGCADDEICNTDCACEPRGCQPDAPTCEPGCADDEICAADCTCEPAPPPPPGLARPSRSTPVDISVDDALVAQVNPDDGTVSFFDVSTRGQEARIARIASSDTPAAEPNAVVIHPDSARAYVANRAAGTVALIDGLDRRAPQLADEVEIGAEPIGLALTPSGGALYVTDWIAGTVTVLDPDDLSTRVVHTVGGNPFAIAISHDGDDDDDDEVALVTQFYGRHQGREALDDGRIGIVHAIDVGTGDIEDIELAPLADCFESGGDQPLQSGCFPNQLYGITIHRAFDRTLAYVLSTAAGPQGPVVFNHNMQALVSVIDLETRRELPERATNLNSLVKLQRDDDDDETRGRRFLNVPTAVAFVARDDVAIGYVTAAGSDIVLRIVHGEDGALAIGAASALNIPVRQNPHGIVTRHGDRVGDAFVAHLITRDLGVLDFRDQALARSVESTAVPAPDTAAGRIHRGKRFFNTGTGIWSREGWGSCQACHPMGLTDNVTWSFAAGPRQTIALDGQYASDDPSDMRALNWTAIFDELHDFELNTRGVSGGSGAIRDDAGPLQSPAGPPFAALPLIGDLIENHQALNGSLKAITRDPEICTNANTCPDWDLIDEYVQSIRSPRGRPDTADTLDRGRALFDEGGCAKCHGGPKWTISRTFYDPTDTDGGDLGERLFATNAAAAEPMDPSDLRGLPIDVNVDATLIAGDDSDGGTPALKRQACNVRIVGTFAADGGAPEERANGQPAQGQNGFNPPSLLGLAAGAPYLHNGAAATLDALIADFPDHTLAGNPNFLPTADDREALVAFLLSIDESTPLFPIPPGSTLCPDDFAP